jgi:aspartyl aminopeptidase
MKNHIEDLIAFLNASPTAFHAAGQAVQRLISSGFVPLSENEKWSLQPGGRYFVRRTSSVLAFIIGTENLIQSGFQIAAAHLDSPALKLKPETLKTDFGVTRIATEVYGGPILSTWTDRPLGIAGKVGIRTDGRTEIKDVDLEQPAAVIPNAAIHLNREVNNGFAYNKQTHLQAYLHTGVVTGDPLKAAVAEKLGCLPEQITQMELFLYDFEKAILGGLDGSLILSSGLDNRAMSHAVLSAILDRANARQTCVAALYDHEEIGSQTPQGADSALLGEVLERISLSQNLSREEHFLALRKSFFISADMAHAYHPSYPEKYDAACSPVMNGGPVIKWNAGYKYASTAESSARFAALCDQADVPHQKFMIRSDLICGSTVGPIVSAQLGIPAVDVGNPLWAMHSIRETAGVHDHQAMIKVLQEYFS